MAIFMRVLTDADMQQVVAGEAVESKIDYKSVAAQSAVSALIATIIKKTADVIVQTEKRTVISVEVDHDGKPKGKVETTSNAFTDEIKKQLKLVLQETTTLKAQHEAAKKKAIKAEKQASDRPKDTGLQTKAERLRANAAELSQALALKEAAVTAFNTLLNKDVHS